MTESKLELRPTEGGYIVRLGNAAIPRVMTAEEIFERLCTAPPAPPGKRGHPMTQTHDGGMR